MAIRARFLKRAGTVAIGDVSAVLEHETLAIQQQDVEGASLTSLVLATRDLRAPTDASVTYLSIYGGPTYRPFMPQFRTALRTSLAFFDDQVRVEVLGRPNPGSLQVPGLGLFDTLTEVTRRHRARVTGVSHPSQLNDGQASLSIWLSPRGRTVADALALGEDVIALMDAVFADGGVLGRQACVDLVRAGRADLLIGQRESQFLDAKRAAYDLASERSVFELAKDVAAFANAGGGTILLGVATKKDATGDVLHRINPISIADDYSRKVASALRAWIYPAPLGVQVDFVAVPDAPQGHGIVVVDVRQQPTELLPMLLRRGELTPKLSAEHMALPIRNGEDTEWANAPRIHSLLVAGRAALAAHPRAGTET